MRNAILYALLCSLCFPATVQAQPETKPTARNLYIGCSLFASETDVPKNKRGFVEPFSGTICGLYSVLAIANNESQTEGKDDNLRFCLPRTAEVSQNPARAMAYAYVDFFEAHAAQIADKPGNEAFVAAMIVKWPC